MVQVIDTDGTQLDVRGCNCELRNLDDVNSVIVGPVIDGEMFDFAMVEPGKSLPLRLDSECGFFVRASEDRALIKLVEITSHETRGA